MSSVLLTEQNRTEQNHLLSRAIAFFLSLTQYQETSQGKNVHVGTMGGGGGLVGSRDIYIYF